LLSDSRPPATGPVENAVDTCVQPHSDTYVIRQVRNPSGRARTPGASLVQPRGAYRRPQHTPLLSGFDLDRDCGIHIREQVHRDLVDPDASDGLVQADVATVNLHPGLALDLLGDLGRSHAAE